MNDHDLSDLSDLSGLETLVRTPDPDTATAPAALPGADRHGARPRAAGSRNAAPAGAAGAAGAPGAPGAPAAPTASPAESGASMAGSGGGRPVGRPRQHALDAGLVGLVAVGIAFLFGPLFTGYDYLGPLLAAPLLAAPAGWLLASRRLGFAAVALVGLLAGLVVTAVVLAPMPWPGRDGLGAVVSAAPGALRGGWAALMTATIPADATGPVLVVPALALWMATLLAAALAVRVRAPLAPVGPLLAGWGFALVTVAASGRGQLAVTGGVLLAAALLGTVRASRPSSPNMPGPTTAAAVTARPVGARPVGGWEAGARGGRHGGRLRGRRPGRGAGSLAVGLPAVALAVALGWAGAVLLPLANGADRYDPRAHTAAPLDSASLVNPLELVKPQLRAQPAVPLFTASFASSDGRLPVDRIRLVSLGTFDGASWRDDEVLRPAGHTLPRGADSGGSGGPGAGGGPATPVVRVRADITLASLEGPYLPSLGRPVSVSGLGGPAAPLVYGPVNATLADTAPARRGLRYDLVTDVPDPGRDRLAHALPALGPAVAPYLSLPAGLPPALVQIAQRVTAGANSQYDKLTALADYLRDPAAFPYDLAARPGHSYGALRAFLTAADPAGRAGYSEQHAAAFALLARIEGFPTRLAVGYLLDRRDADGHGGFTVTTAQAHTWPEVELAGVGWVGFEPTDLSRLDGSPAPSGGPPPSGTSSSGASGVASDAIVVPDLAPRPAPRGGGAGWVVPAGVGAVLVLFGPLVVAEKARRRWRRRRARPPAAAVAGAYREVRDRLAEYGVSRSPALTPSDIAGRVRLLPGGGPVAGPVEALAPVVEAAVFGPAEPGRAEADAAWLSVALVRRELRRRTRWTRRLIVAVDPRVLLPARGARGARRSAAARGPRRAGSAVTGRL